MSHGVPVEIVHEDAGPVLVIDHRSDATRALRSPSRVELWESVDPTETPLLPLLMLCDALVEHAELAATTLHDLVWLLRLTSCRQ